VERLAFFFAGPGVSRQLRQPIPPNIPQPDLLPSACCAPSLQGTYVHMDAGGDTKEVKIGYGRARRNRAHCKGDASSVDAVDE
jgi:hypothetical protein